LTGAHADAIYVTASNGPTTITNNFIDGTSNADAPGQPNSDLRLTSELGSLNDVTVSGNYLLGGGYTVEVGGGPTGSTYQTTNVSVANNSIGFAWYGPYLAGTDTYATVTGNTIVDFTNPAYSTQALAAYPAVGLPTAASVSATSAGTSAATGSAATTVLGNGFIGAHLGGAAGETNFVGGFGSQLLFGGQGANILTYLAIGDGGDRMSAFDPAKDVIDLSRIDADITKAGVQNFTFIGSAPFSVGAQVRYQLDPTNNVTTVQAALAGDPFADFTITLQGRVPLTAANFALTPSQSSADLANGAALTYSKVSTVAGAPTEYACSNVQGRAYTSYQSFYGSGFADLAADNLNLGSSVNELVLFAPSSTVTRGGGSETLQVGTGGADPLSYHPVETIDASPTGSETFYPQRRFRQGDNQWVFRFRRKPGFDPAGEVGFFLPDPRHDAGGGPGERNVPSHEGAIRPDVHRLARRQPHAHGHHACDDRGQSRHDPIHVSSPNSVSDRPTHPALAAPDFARKAWERRVNGHETRRVAAHPQSAARPLTVSAPSDNGAAGS
jgi:hypothetical protein